MRELLTGNYENCKVGNLISISKDMGKKVNFDGINLPKLAPKKDFLEEWQNIENLIDMGDYIEDYYIEVLSKLDPQELIDSLPEASILLDYDTNIYRHLVAFWLELFLNINTYEVVVNPKRDTMRVIKRPEYLKNILEKIIKENYDMSGYDSISAAYHYNKSKEIEDTYKLSLKNN